MIKDHKKEQRIKFQPEKKEENRIFSSTEKKLTHEQKSGSDITHDCLRDFWIKTVWDDVPVIFSVEGMG